MRSRPNRAYDLLILLGVIAVICCLTSMWPLLLLILVGVIVAALILICRAGEPQREQPAPVIRVEQPAETEQDLVRIAYGILQKRITAELTAAYPQVRWIWESPTAMNDIKLDGVYVILLNHAGGYRKAWVQIQGLRLSKLSLTEPEPEPQVIPPAPSESEASTPPEQEKHDKEPTQTNYDFLAYGWVEDHIKELIELCNEGIAAHNTHIFIPCSVLPDREAWDAVCCQLMQQGFPEAEIAEDGIQAIIPIAQRQGDG